MKDVEKCRKMGLFGAVRGHATSSTMLPFYEAVVCSRPAQVDGRSCLLFMSGKLATAKNRDIR